MMLLLLRGCLLVVLCNSVMLVFMNFISANIYIYIYIYIFEARSTIQS